MIDVLHEAGVVERVLVEDMAGRGCSAEGHGWRMVVVWAQVVSESSVDGYRRGTAEPRDGTPQYGNSLHICVKFISQHIPLLLYFALQPFAYPYVRARNFSIFFNLMKACSMFRMTGLRWVALPRH